MDDKFRKNCNELIELINKKSKYDALFNYTENLYNSFVECVKYYYSIPQVFNVIEEFLTHIIKACNSYNEVISVLKTEQQKINEYLNSLQFIQHNYKNISDLKTLLLTDEQYTLDNLHKFGKTTHKVRFNRKPEIREFVADEPISVVSSETSSEMEKDNPISGGLFNSIYNLLFYKNPN